MYPTDYGTDSINNISTGSHRKIGYVSNYELKLLKVYSKFFFMQLLNKLNNIVL